VRYAQSIRGEPKQAEEYQWAAQKLSAVVRRQRAAAVRRIN
jgi:hypothetical protein